MNDIKESFKELGFYLFMVGLAGAFYGGNVYCGSLAEKNRIAESHKIQTEEKKKKMVLELEACILNSQGKVITPEGIECIISYLK